MAANKGAGMSLKNLGINNRTAIVLKSHRIETLDQLTSMSSNDLLALTNFGRRSLFDVIAALDAHGVSLAGGNCDPTVDARIAQQKNEIDELKKKLEKLEQVYLLTLKTDRRLSFQKLAEETGYGRYSVENMIKRAARLLLAEANEEADEKKERLAIVANRKLSDKNAKLEQANNELRTLLQEKQNGEQQLHGEDWVLMCCLVFNCAPDSIVTLAPQFGLSVGEIEIIAIKKVNELVTHWKKRLNIDDDPYKFTDEDLDRSIAKLLSSFESGKRKPLQDAEMIAILREAAIAARTFEGARLEDTGDAVLKIMVAIATLVHRKESD